MKGKMLFLCSVMAVWLPAFPGPAASQSTALSWLDGEWEGTGYQVSNGGTWTIRFSGHSENNYYAIEYPSLYCGGNWTIISGNDYRAEFVEMITAGTDVCVNGGIVILTRVDDRHIAFTYFSPDRILDAFSTLVRRN